ncbi:hypothetical protein DICPUDRAFT_156839 [Dictyostelium purpureum]|uniref:Uncharacterized protein n=1 Tax=Dictyostelium purpureum TaxID=5786 RepID=F0ZXK1_DICPU|nr:uncharacterized protein DICPUDRAFT_156839 [Dictyostelium purpureum]EGC31329.1 hypothetical protein DICPUDRAFT_156839 [Dictyostelium purpureum]|eukprot:XP_003292138.1 hypothetical protein DICPUDRAFT_156839 [Dictyostelium purpureum]
MKDIYNDPQCVEPQKYGIGYSSALDACVTIDYDFSFVFKQKNDIEIQWNKYPYKGSSSLFECSDESSIQNSTFYVGSCIPSSDIQLNTQHLNMKSTYYKLYFTQEVYYPSGNVMVSSYSINDCNANSNIYLIEYIYSGSKINVGSKNNPFIFLCSNGEPYTQYCPNARDCQPPQPLDVGCNQIEPFYNNTSSDSSSEHNESSNDDSQTGCLSAGYSGYTGCLPNTGKSISVVENNGGRKQSNPTIHNKPINNNNGGNGFSGNNQKPIFYNSITCSWS